MGCFQTSQEKVFKEKGIDFSQRLQAWNSLCASRLLSHCATWGHLSSVPLQNLSSCCHSSHRQLLTRSQHEGSRTNDGGVRVDAQVLPLPQLLSTRRIGLAQRILIHGPALLHGLIQSTDDGTKGWTSTLRKDLAWLDSFEPGAPSTFPDLVQTVLTTSKNALEARLKRAKTAAILYKHRKTISHR